MPAEIICSQSMSPSQLFSSGLRGFTTIKWHPRLYEAVRGVWKVGVARSNVELVFAVANGIVREVFVVNQWHPAGTTHYVTRNMKDIQVRGRWEFTGIPASDKIRNKYIGKSVAHYFQRGNANPIFYVNAKVET